MNNELIQQLLERRNISSQFDVNRFLFGTYKELYPPAMIGYMSESCDMILYFVSQGKRIYILGDYDVDGITGTAILFLTLIDLGADVHYRLPDRISEGYGISKAAVEEIAQNGADLIITIDNGISCYDEVQRAKELGISVVVVDHHKPAGKLPPADFIVNPHLDDYPFKGLAGCGLALKMSCQLYCISGFDLSYGYKYLDLAAIGTIADRVPMLDENRIIVKEGLRRINSKKYCRLGVSELLNSFSLKRGHINEDDIGFNIAPAINAPGRLIKNGADESLKLILCDDPQKCFKLAFNLFQINKHRKEATSDGLKKAIEYVENNNLTNDHILIVFIPEVNEGIIGIVAGKIVDRYNKPVIVITESVNCFKGSARSIESIDIFEAINNCGYYFEKYGGHPQAAGVVLRKDLKLINRLRRDINKFASQYMNIQPSEGEEIFDIIDAAYVDYRLATVLERCAPFGCGNPKPKFLIKNFITSYSRNREFSHYIFMGNNKTDLKIYGKNYNVVGFGLADYYENVGAPRLFDVKGYVSIDYYTALPRIFVQAADIIPGTDNLSDMGEQMQLITNIS